MSDSGIYAKIDWFSAVFQSCSINDILEYLYIGHESDDFFAHCFSRALGYDTQITYAFDGVSIAVSYNLINHLADSSNISVFDFVFDRLRLDISGTGLDNLRDKWAERGYSQDLSLDYYLRTPPDLFRGDMHVTRCDFAFDLIDYQPEFLDILISHLNNVTAQGWTRCPIMHTQGGLCFSIRTGDQKTVYLGSPRSDKMLRVYDKKLQLTDDDGVWLRTVEHSDCSSWIRLELQLRNGKAHGLCYGDGDFMSIFRYIYEEFSFRDPSYSSNTQKPAAFWDELFQWDSVPQIVLNSHFVPQKSTYDRARSYILGTAFKSLCIFFAGHPQGREGALREIDDLLHTLQVSDLYNINKKWASLLISLHSLSSKYDGRISYLPGISVDFGRVSFK